MRAKSGKIAHIRLVGRQRRYQPRYIQDQPVAPLTVSVPTIAYDGCVYARVSTRKQLRCLQEQVRSLRDTYPSHRVVSDVASGLNFKRRGIRELLRRSWASELRVFVITHRDRLCRLAYDLLEYVFQQNNTQIEVLFKDQNTSADRELAEDVVSIVTVFGARLYGARSGEGRRRKASERSVGETPERLTTEPTQ